MDELKIHRYIAEHLSRETGSHLRAWLTSIGAWTEADDAAVAIERERYENDDREDRK